MFFVIEKELLYKTLWKKQESEEALKGGINKNLYIYQYDKDSNLISKTFWKRNKWSTISGTIGKTMRFPNINRITLSNEFNDWEILLFSRD
jgi:hypothetical protein